MRDLYLIHAPQARIVKIGASSDPDRRLRTLRTAHPYPLELVAVLESAGHHERLLHHCLWREHKHNEWFNDVLLQYVAEAGSFADWVAQVVQTWIPIGRLKRVRHASRGLQISGDSAAGPLCVRIEPLQQHT